MGLSRRRVCRIVFSALRGSISVLVWTLKGIDLPEPPLLLLITQHHSELEQRQAARELGILYFNPGAACSEISLSSSYSGSIL